MKFNVAYTILALCLSLLSSCYNSFDSDGALNQSVADANVTIGELHSLYDNSYLRLFTGQWSVRGVVIANDSGGNFYGSFIAEDGGYAVAFLDGLSASHIRHVEGATLLIDLDGLAMSRYNGVLQVGLPAADYSYYALDYLTSLPLVEAHVSIESYGDVYCVETLSYDELSTSMCGMVIRVDNLTPLYDEDEVDSVVRWSGYRGFVTPQGDTIYTYVSSYADFAYEALSGSSYSITGVLQWGSGSDGSESFILKPRTIDDLLSI